MTFTDPKRDRAKRATDVLKLHYLAKGIDINGSWIAIRLSDGSSDNILYPTKAAARDHQLHPTQCAYVSVYPSHCDEEGMFIYLNFMENLYDNGYDLSDPDRQFVMR